MATSRVRATDTPEQAEPALIGTWGDDQDGLRLVDHGGDTAGIVLIRAGRHRDIGTVSKGGKDHPVWSPMGMEEPTYFRDHWASMLYSALARWRDRTAS